MCSATSAHLSSVQLQPWVKGPWDVGIEGEVMVDTGKRSCRLFDRETFTEDPNGIMGPHAVLPKHLVQFLKWSQNACPLLGSLKKLGTRR